MTNQTTTNIMYTYQDFINIVHQYNNGSYPLVDMKKEKKPVTVFKMVKKEGTGGA